MEKIKAIMIVRHLETNKKDMFASIWRFLQMLIFSSMTPKKKLQHISTSFSISPILVYGYIQDEIEEDLEEKIFAIFFV